MQEVLIIRNSGVNYLYDVVLADFEGEASKRLATLLTFEEASSAREEFEELYISSLEAA